MRKISLRTCEQMSVSGCFDVIAKNLPKNTLNQRARLVAVENF